MGGLREDVVAQKVATPTGTEKVVGKVRFHENAGEVHFHDDDKGIKVAIPVGTWYKGWDAVATGQKKKFSYTDAVNKTRLNVRIKTDKKKGDKGAKSEVGILLSIEPVDFSAEFSALQKFTRS